jgi:hypoxanthine phosphoribosyltransferase
MINHINYTNDEINGFVHTIIRQMLCDNWTPNYIVGVTRSGLDTALKLSHYFDVPLETLKIGETNCWMAEDAFGYVDLKDRIFTESRWDIAKRKNILIVDAINDSNSAFTWIKNDWQSCCFPNELSWGTVWGNNVKFAVLVDDASSNERVAYQGAEINQFETSHTITFPWEQWWNPARV